MKFAELKNMNINELKDLLKEKEQKMFALRQQAFNRSLKQVHEISVIRRTIAQIKTLLTDKK